MKESDLSAPVMRWLKGRGYTPYGEVPWGIARTIDIVGLNISERRWPLESVELKLSLTKRVIQQAYDCAAFGPAWCAVPSTPRSLELPKRLGIGVLKVGVGVEVLLKPTFKPGFRTLDRIEEVRESLNRLKPWRLAGEPNRAGVGPANDVYRLIESYRETHPGADWKELFENIPNHYASYGSMQSAMSNLQQRRRWRERRLVKATATPPTTEEGDE